MERYAHPPRTARRDRPAAPQCAADDGPQVRRQLQRRRHRGNPGDARLLRCQRHHLRCRDDRHPGHQRRL